MEWYNILSIVLGALGGIGGFVGLYKAKSEKTGIDITNMKDMLEEAHKMYNAICEEKDKVQEEFTAYKRDNMQYIAEFKERFAKLETRLDKTDDMVLHLKGAVFQGYRCKFPDNITDCPVLKEYEKFQCDKCDKCEDTIQ